MALLHCDGFDHYGVIANMSEGAWAEVGGGLSLSSANPRTGSHAIRSGNGTSTTASILRRVLGGAKTTVGIGMVTYYTNLPTVAAREKLFDFRDASNVIQVTIGLDTTGTISAWRSSTAGTLLGTSSTPVITANAYQHVEAMVFFSQTVGTIEVRVNGVTALSLTGLDTVQSSLVECSQVTYGGSAQGNTTSQSDVDDVFCYDNTGSFNNTFIGDRRVLTLSPTSNTVQADFVAVGAATGYECIDEVSPDGDTTYISSATVGSPGDISEFGIANLPAGISAVSGVILVEMARKTEAGPANTQWSVVSGSSESPGTSNPLTEIYTYRQNVFETDPATAAPFTSTAVDGLLIKVERTL